MSLWGDIKNYRAYKRFQGISKELWEMEDKKLIQSKTVWGGLILAACPLIQQILPTFGVPPETIDAIVTLLRWIGGSLGVVGVRQILGKGKKDA